MMLAGMSLSRAAQSLPRALDNPAAVCTLRCLHSQVARASETRSPTQGGASPPQEPETPHPPQQQQQQQDPHKQHWLDHYFPGARQWLQDKNRAWWIKGLVEARSEQYHQLAGRQEVLRSSIEREYHALLDRHAHRIVDERSETHLQVACLALATHKVLLPFLRDELEVLQVIREHMGERTSPMLSFLMKAVKFLQKDAYATLCNRLRGLQLDYGRGFTTQLQLGEFESSLTITSCFYHEVFEAEGLPQLARCACCSQDAIWLTAAQFGGVSAGLESSIARGDRECCFRVVRLGKDKGGSSAAGDGGKVRGRGVDGSSREGS